MKTVPFRQNNSTAETSIQMTCVIDFPMLPSAVGFGEKLVPLFDVLWPKATNKPFTSCFLPLFQNEAWCTPVHMKMNLIFKTMNVRQKLISTFNVVM